MAVDLQALYPKLIHLMLDTVFGSATPMATCTG
jgi:hypothetical protein